MVTKRYTIYNDHHMIIDTDKSGLNFAVKVKFADAIKM